MITEENPRRRSTDNFFLDFFGQILCVGITALLFGFVAGYEVGKHHWH